jgi:hypothetical protein
MVGSPFGAGHFLREQFINFLSEALEAIRRVAALDAALVALAVMVATVSFPPVSLSPPDA